MADRLPWGTLRVRLAVWNTAVVLAMTVAALLGARYAARVTLYADADAELRAGAREVTLALHDLFPNMDAVVDEMRRKAVSHDARGWFTQLLTEDGRTVWKSAQCPAEVAAYPPHNLDRAENIVQVGPYRYVRLQIAQSGHPVFHVRVGTSTRGFDASLAGMLRALTAVGMLLCGLTPLAGWWLAARATQPVAAILETANRLEPTRLADRLPDRGCDDELDRLARTINGLLDDVADHVDRQQRFLADAAHELRGPLAALRSTIEVALSHDRTADEYRDSLEVVLDEVRYLAKLANGLLTLTEYGADRMPPAAQPVDLDAVARQAVAMFAGAAEDRGIALSVTASTGATMVAGDAGELRQVIGNLLDNAIRSTPAGGTVVVGIVRDAEPDHLTLTVADSGVGIAAEHLPRLFDRFYKVDQSRSREGSGRSGGLGLPICRALVERHGGSIAVASRPGAGTTVTVRLPTPAECPRPAVLAQETAARPATAR